MALPKNMRLKGHRTFNYLHKYSKKYYGKLMDLKIAKSNPSILLSHGNNTSPLTFKIAFTVSKKFAKKSVERNRIRRRLHEYFLKNFKNEFNHIPYWALVNLKKGDFFHDDDKLFNEFRFLLSKSGLRR